MADKCPDGLETAPIQGQCPNIKCVSETMSGERYRCEKCGLSFFLDYEEMK